MLDRFSDRVGDVLVGICATVVILGWTLMVAAVRGPESAAVAEPLAWAVTFIACTALFFRSRYPLTVTVVTLVCTAVYYPASALDGPTVLTYIIALYTLAALGRTRTAAVVAAASFLILLVPELLSDFAHLSPAETLLLSGWFVAIVALGATVAHYRAYRAQTAVSVGEARRRSVAEERLRIARELHDAVGHHLSLIHVQTAAALRRLDKDPGYATAGTLEVVSEASQLSLRELRSMVGVLREAGEDSPTGPGPSLDRLPTLVAAAEAAGLEVSLHRDGHAELPVAVDAAAYRVVQESVTNTVRHAEASAVRINVVAGTSVLTVSIVDNGAAHSKAGKVTTGNGLAGMRERAESLGGTFDAGPRESGGFFVEATWPLEAQS